MIAFKVRNTFVTLVAMSSLILSFFAAYYWVAAHFAIQNATLLWVAGLFVMLGIGADDIFLMIDSFEHAKITDGIDDNNDESNELDNAQVEAIREVVIKAVRGCICDVLRSIITTTTTQVQCSFPLSIKSHYLKHPSPSIIHCSIVKQAA
jgi:energy-coupling factor transporter transmembrane protein EcfT